ncbi:hypothetical protein F4820DRAFT_443064 [Hypoxylon rubiginosum]|uniref:Uncharacterized protein n=1 Tax=Hypoxylon rubiginosum TaxID=110542 RepID=A0ACB9ZGM4_9PEZI|nr:hypothetical protein F4820DRAFT_443064 [Hypoxylon rubiginosum]
MSFRGSCNPPILAPDPSIWGNLRSARQYNDQEQNRAGHEPQEHRDEQQSNGEVGSGLPVQYQQHAGHLAYNPASASNSVYQGFNNQNVSIPNHENTCLWITRLPPDCTHHDILSRLRGVGKVFSLYINPPSGDIPTSAAKLNFWDQYDVDRFLTLVGVGGFRFNQVPPTVTMNRNLSAPRPASGYSRVLHIRGPRAIVNEQTLNRIFRAKFFFFIDEVISHFDDGSTAWIEYRFASYYGQASNA